MAKDDALNHKLANVGIFLLYASLTLLMTYPVIADFSSQYAGSRDDLWVHQWTFWWIKRALANGQNPFFTDMLYFPNGASLTSHNIAWFNIALWLPLQTFLGQIQAYNLIFLTVFTLNGFCMYLFAFELMRNLWGAFLAGLVFGFYPYIMSHNDHTNMMVVLWVPLTMLFLRRFLFSQRWRYGFLATLCLAMVGITRWQFLPMSGFIIGGFVAYLLLVNPELRNRQTVRGLLFVALVAGTLMTPLAYPLVKDQLAADDPGNVVLYEPQFGSTDLFAYLLPIKDGIWREQVESTYARFTVNRYYVPAFGYSVMVLILAGLMGLWRKTILWAALAILYLLFALGPILTFHGQQYPQVPMPYRLVEEWFLVKIIRRPDRLNIYLSLPIGMLAGWGLIALRQRIQSLHWQNIAPLLIIGIILIEYAPLPFPTTALETPAWYAQLSPEAEPYAILDLPTEDRRWDKWYMAYQMNHGIPIANGHISRMPAEAFDFFNSVPFLRHVEEQNFGEKPYFGVEHGDVARQLRLLADAGIRYIIIHKDFTAEGYINEWRDQFSLPAFYEDDRLIVYRTAPKFGDELQMAHQLTAEIGLVSGDPPTPKTVQGGVAKIRLRWGALAPPSNDYDACFQWVDQADKIVNAQCQPVYPTWQPEKWEENELVRASYSLIVPNDMPAANYTLQLALRNQATGQLQGETVGLGDIIVQPFDPEKTVDFRWGGQISLNGYTLIAATEGVIAALFWQGLAPMDNGYKFFVHLVDPANDAILAQTDLVPRQWSYPTYAWEAGEIVRDDIYLPIDSTLELDELLLRIGWYDEISGERLPASHSEDGATFLAPLREN